VVDDLPTAQPLLEHLDELRAYIGGRNGWRRQRDRREDFGRALRRAGALLWGERVVRPIRAGTVHEAQMIVLAATVDRLIHPDKRLEPRTGSPNYNDRARRRLTAWYWSTTFSGRVPASREARAEAIEQLVEWCGGRGLPPAAASAPDVEWIAGVFYGRRSWRYEAILALMGRRAPRDLLTGERLEVEQFFGKRLQGHHLFPRQWCAEHPAVVPPERVDSVVNIAPLTAYTNGWIQGRAPAQYLDTIRSVIGERALSDLLQGHLVTPDLLRDHDFEAFYSDRLTRIHKLLAAAVDPEGPA